MQQPRNQERGAVFVEKLIAMLPLLLTFFATWELAELTAAKLVVQRACSAAGRAAMVVLPDDPVFYDGEPVGSYDGFRRDDIELAAGMVLSAIPRLGADFELDVGAPTGASGTFEVSLTAPYQCGLATAYCLGADSIELSATTTHVYHGAKYTYVTPDGLGSGGGALVSAGGRSGARDDDEGDDGADDGAGYRTGKRKRDDCNQTCKDPTANIKPSPSLKNCQMKPPDQKGPLYSYGNKGNKTCNIDAVYLDSNGKVTYCFNSYGTPKSKNGPRNEAVADSVIVGKVDGKCPSGTKWSVDYEPVNAGTTESARVDLSPYAVANSTVLIPAKVSGAKRADADDSSDFKFSWEAFRNKNPQHKGKSDTALNDREYPGYTWHHNRVVKIGNTYYYEMMLVPTTLHETASHAGGSSWIRGAGATQDPTEKPSGYKEPTATGTDLLTPRTGKPAGC